MRLPVPAVILAATLLAACDKLDLEAPAPAVTADVDTLPALPTSTLDIPLTYDLSPVVQALENAVPKKFGNLNERHAVPGQPRMRVAFEAVRDPFKVSLDGQVAHLTAVIHYAGRGWYKAPVVPEVSGSCGAEGVRPRARIQVTSALSLTQGWRLRGKTRIAGVEPYSSANRDKCRVTVFNISVTGRVIEATRNLLNDKRGLVDQKIASIDIRSRFEGWWHLLQRPIPLTDSVWLLLNPSAVRMGETVGVKRTLVTALGFSASPRVVTGRKPPTVETPLPPLYPAAVGDGLHILMEGVVDYALATRLLEKGLVGKIVEGKGQTLVVKNVRLFGIGGGRLALELEFGGTVSGRIYFIGTPKYDPARNELFVPDLDYDAGSANLLVSGFEWLKHDQVRDYFRSHARWSVGDIVQQGTDQLSKGLNRELAPGVKLSADVKRVQALSVNARRDAIRVRAQADANARLTVKQDTR
ncbi:MAG TPA: DUF4403 family protein [Gemmatimonadaceae bacterium]|nr:DUF4403 family protein [Gemmatimonadaceae bacterium]